MIPDNEQGIVDVMAKLRDYSINNLIRMSREERDSSRAYQATMTLYMIAEGRIQEIKDSSVDGISLPKPDLNNDDVFSELDEIFGTDKKTDQDDL